MEQMNFLEIKKEPIFSDVKFMTAKEKERAYKTFKKIIDARDIEKLDNNLYKHLYLHADFIAHYNFHGFKTEYNDVDGFRRFINHFLQLRHELMWCAAYKDINGAILDYVFAHSKNILRELDQAEKNQEILLLKSLARKHNFSLSD